MKLLRVEEYPDVIKLTSQIQDIKEKITLLDTTFNSQKDEFVKAQNAFYKLRISRELDEISDEEFKSQEKKIKALEKSLGDFESNYNFEKQLKTDALEVLETRLERALEKAREERTEDHLRQISILTEALKPHLDEISKVIPQIAEIAETYRVEQKTNSFFIDYYTNLLPKIIKLLEFAVQEFPADNSAYHKFVSSFYSIRAGRGDL